MSSPKNKRAKRNEKRRGRSQAPGSPSSIRPEGLEARDERASDLPEESEDRSSMPDAKSDGVEVAPAAERASEVPATKREGSVKIAAAAAISDAKPNEVSEARADVNAEGKADTKADTKADAKHDAKSEAKQDAKHEEPESTDLDTGSVAPVTRSHAPQMDFDDDDHEHGAFFAKPIEDVHLEEMRREAPDLHEHDLHAPAYRVKKVDHRARSLVLGVLGVCALIGATGLIRRAIAPSHRTTSTEVAAQVAPPPPPQQQMTQVAPPPPAPVETAQVTPVDTATVASAAPSAEATAAPSAVAEVASAPPSAATTEPPPAAATTAAAPTATAALAAAPTVAPTVAPTAAPTAAAVPASTAAADEAEAAMSGPQLLAAARKAINSNPSKAAGLARKAASKGAGGSAYYVLGAAYQMMGASAGAKNAYASCAKTGAPEAAECAALAEGM